MSISPQELKNSIDSLGKWVENQKYKGYEPFDGLSSYLMPFTFGNLFLQRLLQQLVRQSPINIRPLIGITKKESTKGRGYMGWGYLKMFQITGEISYQEKAIQCLDWLIENKSPNYTAFSWGNHFCFSSRGGKLEKYEPIIVWTSIIGQVFLDAYEIVGEKKYLEVAESICNWIASLPRENTATGSCLSYVMFAQRSIHNSNMLGAAMLARSAKHLNNNTFLEIARSAMTYSCSRQHSSGAWFYGEEPKFHWIDNFHTGYNLDSLKCYIDSSDDAEFISNLTLGIKYYMDNFFEESGRPKYYHDRTFPVDSQCISQSIETLAKFHTISEYSLDLSCKVAKWAIENMRSKRGYFYYRQYPLVEARTPMLHWAEATMYNALSLLLCVLNSSKYSHR